MTFKLVNARPSPFGRKIAIALLEKGLPFETHFDLPWSDGTCTPDYNPIEQLPILVTPEGEVLYDSPYILEWLETRYPEPPLLPGDTIARLAARKRQMLGERLMEFAQSMIFESHRLEPSAAWVDRQTRKVLGGLRELEKIYSELGEPGNRHLDLGDVAVATTLLIFEFVVREGLSPDLPALRWRGDYPQLTRFVEHVEARPSFSATAPTMMDVDLQATVG